MIEEFVGGGQIQIDPENYPREIRQIAVTEARNAAAMIVHLARQCKDNPVLWGHTNRLAASKDATPAAAFARLTMRYINSRPKRARSKA